MGRQKSKLTLQGNVITEKIKVNTWCLEAKTINNYAQELGGVTEVSRKMTTSEVNFERDRRGCKMRKSEKLFKVLMYIYYSMFQV